MWKARTWKVAAIAALGILLGGAEEPARHIPSTPAAPDVSESRYTLAPFGEINVYRPARAPKGVVLFLSDGEGWTGAVEGMARALVQKDMLVAGVSTPALMRAMEGNKSRCNNPNYPFVDLARDIQHRMTIKTYRKPMLVGYGDGATLAYASIAQWPNAGYQGVVSIDPRPGLAGRKPWCAAAGFVARHVSKPRPQWLFMPNRRIAVPWVVLREAAITESDGGRLLRFVSAVPRARLIELPRADANAAGPAQLRSHILSAVQALEPPPIPVSVAGEVPVPDMPLTILPATGGTPSDLMAIAYSGDGGWVGIDHDLAGQIAAAGIPVVGVDSLSYFWSARTPQGAGRDLGQLIRSFSERWHKRRILLIGYSFGADAMPYMIDNLDAEARSRIESVALLGLSSTADFQFHLTSWLDMSSSDALPTIPAIIRLKGLTVRCVRGEQEVESACPSVPKGLAQQYLVPGDHHFDRNAPLLARIVLGQRKAGFVTR